MRTGWTVAVWVLVINAVALAGLIGWLALDGRLSRDRVQRVVEIFSITVAEEEAQAEQAAKLAEEAQAKAEEHARLEAVSDGPITLAQRLESEMRDDEVEAQRYARMKSEQEALLKQIDLARQLLAQERQQLDAERRAFAEAVEREIRLKRDEDFQQTVRMYESIRPRQAKQIFQEMLAQNKTSEVVDYLAAMQLRKAASVLKEFKQPDEIQQAAALLEALRERGIDTSGLEQNEPGIQGASG